MSEFLNNPKHWRDRADQTRVAADDFSRNNPQRKMLLRVAKEYDRIADRAEQWQTVSEAERRSAS